MGCSLLRAGVASLLLFSVLVEAEVSSKEDAVRVGEMTVAEELRVGLDISTEYLRQQFDDADAEIETVALLPYLQFGNWELSLDLPWQHIEGDYFVNGRYPALANFCSGVTSMTQLQQLQLIRSGELTARQIYFCNNNPDLAGSEVSDEVSGYGDATLYLNYAVPLDAAAQWFGSATLGYKHDNGNVDDGLGSGTQDVIGELALAGNFEWASVVASAGYVTIANNDTGLDYDDYLYGAVDLGLHPLQALTLGGRFDYQQVSAEQFDDIESVTIYLRWRVLELLSVRLFNTDYLDVTGYPEREYGGSVTLQF